MKTILVILSILVAGATQATADNLLAALGRFLRKDKDEQKAPARQVVIEPATTLTENEVRALFVLWNDALATGDSRIVASRYASEAVLLAPFSTEEPLTDVNSIKEYFDTFLLQKPLAKILEDNIRLGDGWAKNSGVYEFTMGADGSKLKGRYSFIYVKEDGHWKIVHHHSNVMPVPVADQTIDEQQVKNLFNLWNDALAAGDSVAMANRYAKKAEIWPTVPRTTSESIKDYFDTFLTLKPQGKILESNVETWADFVQDTGIYEFTMGVDGSKVRGRYFFIYVLEDGQWKISHHHSTMYEDVAAAKAPLITKDEVRNLFSRWNAALATGDSSIVAARYSSKAEFLPSDSKTPCTTPESIKEYFDTFLLRKPQAVVLDGHILTAFNWAQDAGVYELAFADDGSKVQVRYSFVYVLEDDDWKISHHDYSILPESLAFGAAKTI